MLATHKEKYRSSTFLCYAWLTLFDRYMYEVATALSINSFAEQGLLLLFVY